MSDSPPSPPTPTGKGRRPRRARRVLAWAGGVVLLAIAALAAAAIIPGSHRSGGAPAQARADVAAQTATTNAKPLVTHVFDSKVSAKKYGALIAGMENGTNAQGQIVSDLPPLKRAQFRRPIAEFRAYAERWAVTLTSGTRALTRALRSGDRARAERAWSAAFSDYLHLGAVYGLLPGDLNDRLAGLPPVIGSTRFVGLHRIEMGLWTGQPVRSLVRFGVALGAADADLRHTLPRVEIDVLDYVTRCHEILEDAQRDLMSGTQVPWSHAGVLGTAAGVVATREVLHTLSHLMTARDNTLGASQYWLRRLAATLHHLQRPDGTYPALNQLSAGQLQNVDGVLEGTLNELQQVPPTMEFHGLVRTPSIPDTTK